jgi:hypothetical protein
MISCLLANWGLTITLGFLLAFSEWLGKNKKIKENCIYDFIVTFLRKISN